MLKWIASFIVVVIVALGVALVGAGKGWFGVHEGPGAVTDRRVAAAIVAQRAESERAAARGLGNEGAKQILFGDLHVHTTFSFDAFMTSLPMLQGEGAHPPADACDFARYCSALDFWSINDHAEGLTPQHWQETVESIRQCNAVAGDPANPDVVAFLGWEWTQIGDTPENHYGHKNVVLKDLEDGKIPTRPIASRGVASQAAQQNTRQAGRLGYLAVTQGNQRYYDFATYVNEILGVGNCPEGVPVRDLPADCRESAATPQELFAKLDDWNLESIVIPHGTTWGFYTPSGSAWDKQLNQEQHDPQRQTLIEVFSGHGNSEEFRDFTDVELSSAGARCPEPTNMYLPSCWQAGEIIRKRCLDAGLAADECEKRAAEARQNYVDARVQGHLTVPGVNVEEWLDAGQCRNCFLPSFNYRPRSSVQYVMALSNFDDPGNPMRFRFGFMASSDNHSARPGTGYKEFARLEMTEAAGPIDEDTQKMLRVEPRPPEARSERFDRATSNLQAFQLFETERQASFFMTGGLVAVHADGRDRGAIWDALERREVYGTSGDRILLWFDLFDAPGAAAPNNMLPMGSEVSMSGAPRFQVRAVGAALQNPGCPEHAAQALGAERLRRLCRNECYHPSERRKRITRIEVVRIRPQAFADEPIAELIADPWRVLPCTPDPAGCVVTFDDPDFSAVRRDTVYYVRAIEEPSEAVNAANLRCEHDENGVCRSVDICHGDYRTGADDDCLGRVEERAWSSPIFVNYARGS
jgi:hypothetical protein